MMVTVTASIGALKCLTTAAVSIGAERLLLRR